MNNDIRIVIIKRIECEEIVKNGKEKLRGKEDEFVGLCICEWFVEKMLRI